MKTMMLAAVAALSLGMGVAFADGGEGPAANTEFTLLPGVIAQVPGPSSSAFAQGRTNQTQTSYVTRTETAPQGQSESTGG
jgi:hypothetical protein